MCTILYVAVDPSFTSKDLLLIINKQKLNLFHKNNLYNIIQKYYVNGSHLDVF